MGLRTPLPRGWGKGEGNLSPTSRPPCKNTRSLNQPLSTPALFVLPCWDVPPLYSQSLLGIIIGVPSGEPPAVLGVLRDETVEEWERVALMQVGAWGAHGANSILRGFGGVFCSKGYGILGCIGGTLFLRQYPHKAFAVAGSPQDKSNRLTQRRFDKDILYRGASKGPQM